MSAKDKKYLQKLFREAGRPRMFVYEVLSVLLAILISLSDKDQKSHIFIIDLEYPGWSDQIRDFVLRFTGKLGIKLSAEQIEFASIGRKSEAHQNAYKVFRGRKKPAKVVGLDEILPLILV